MSHTAWMTHDRFGMFIHFGLYALPARHEWVKTREQIPEEEYDIYFRHFDPDLLDARDWARQARAAGMRYAVLTTKHHDGFCLWDSDLTDYTSMHTPYGRDIVADFVEAFREAGLKVGFYHSLIDWHHQDFPVDGLHPRRDDDVAELNSGRDIGRYREYLYGQVRELLTRYGKVDYLFYDFSYNAQTHPQVWGNKDRDTWGSEDLMALTRELQPGIVINDRLDLPGDVTTPEQYQPEQPMELKDGQSVWEACQTLNGSWGYFRDNKDAKTADMLVRMLVDGVSKDGNLLFNVGPTGRGTFDPESEDLLAQLGEWMRLHERAVVGAGASDVAAPRDTRITQRGNRLYVHLFAWPFGHVHLPGLAGKVEYAQLLNDGSEIRRTVIEPDAAAHNTSLGGLPEGTLTLEIPVHRPDVLVPVIELILRADD